MNARQKGILLTIASSVLWGTSFPLIKFILFSQPPGVFLLSRFAFATIAFFLFAFIKRRKIIIEKSVIIYGAMIAASFILQYTGQTLVSASQAAVLLNSSPVIVPFIAYFTLNERVRNSKYISSLIGMAGIVLVTGIGAADLSHLSLLGSLIIVVAAVIISLFIVYSKNITHFFDPIELYSGAFIFATLFLLPYSIPSLGMLPSFFTSWQAVFASLYLAIACSLVPYILWYRGLSYLSATESTVVSLTEPIVAIAISWPLLNEPLAPLQLVGAATVLLSITIISL